MQSTFFSKFKPFKFLQVLLKLCKIQEIDSRFEISAFPHVQSNPNRAPDLIRLVPDQKSKNQKMENIYILVRVMLGLFSKGCKLP